MRPLNRSFSKLMRGGLGLLALLLLTGDPGELHGEEQEKKSPSWVIFSPTSAFPIPGTMQAVVPDTSELSLPQGNYSLEAQVAMKPHKVPISQTHYKSLDGWRLQFIPAAKTQGSNEGWSVTEKSGIWTPGEFSGMPMALWQSPSMVGSQNLGSVQVEFASALSKTIHPPVALLVIEAEKPTERTEFVLESTDGRKFFTRTLPEMLPHAMKNAGENTNSPHATLFRLEPDSATWGLKDRSYLVFRELGLPFTETWWMAQEGDLTYLQRRFHQPLDPDSVLDVWLPPGTIRPLETDNQWDPKSWVRVNLQFGYHEGWPKPGELLLSDHIPRTIADFPNGQRIRLELGPLVQQREANGQKTFLDEVVLVFPFGMDQVKQNGGMLRKLELLTAQRHVATPTAMPVNSHQVRVLPTRLESTPKGTQILNIMMQDASQNEQDPNWNGYLAVLFPFSPARPTGIQLQEAHAVFSGKEEKHPLFSYVPIAVQERHQALWKRLGEADRPEPSPDQPVSLVRVLDLALFPAAPPFPQNDRNTSRRSPPQDQQTIIAANSDGKKDVAFCDPWGEESPPVTGEDSEALTPWSPRPVRHGNITLRGTFPLHPLSTGDCSEYRIPPGGLLEMEWTLASALNGEAWFVFNLGTGTEGIHRIQIQSLDQEGRPNSHAWVAQPNQPIKIRGHEAGKLRLRLLSSGGRMVPHEMALFRLEAQTLEESLRVAVPEGWRKELTLEKAQDGNASFLWRSDKDLPWGEVTKLELMYQLPDILPDAFSCWLRLGLEDGEGRNAKGVVCPQHQLGTIRLSLPAFFQAPLLRGNERLSALSFGMLRPPEMPPVQGGHELSLWASLEGVQSKPLGEILHQSPLLWWNDAPVAFSLKEAFPWHTLSKGIEVPLSLGQVSIPADGIHDIRLADHPLLEVRQFILRAAHPLPRPSSATGSVAPHPFPHAWLVLGVVALAGWRMHRAGLLRRGTAHLLSWLSAADPSWEGRRSTKFMMIWLFPALLLFVAAGMANLGYRWERGFNTMGAVCMLMAWKHAADRLRPWWRRRNWVALESMVFGLPGHPFLAGAMMMHLPVIVLEWNNLDQIAALFSASGILMLGVGMAMRTWAQRGTDSPHGVEKLPEREGERDASVSA